MEEKSSSSEARSQQPKSIQEIYEVKVNFNELTSMNDCETMSFKQEVQNNNWSESMENEIKIINENGSLEKELPQLEEDTEDTIKICTQYKILAIIYGQNFQFFLQKYLYLPTIQVVKPISNNKGKKHICHFLSLPLAT